MKIRRINESTLHKLIKEVVNEILAQNTYQVSFTFYIALGEDRISYQKSIKSKNKLLDILDTIKEVVDYDVENDGEDWCVNCIAQIHADSIDNAKEAMEQLFANVPFNWDYHYIKGLDTKDYYEP